MRCSLNVEKFSSVLFHPSALRRRSLGCVLWEMMFLEKPFHSSELLALQTGKVQDPWSVLSAGTKAPACSSAKLWGPLQIQHQILLRRHHGAQRNRTQRSHVSSACRRSMAAIREVHIFESLLLALQTSESARVRDSQKLECESSESLLVFPDLPSIRSLSYA